MTEPSKVTQEKPKLTNERYMQAKTFLDNGVITKEQFLELTHGQADLEEENDTQALASLQKSMSDIDLRLKRMETMIGQIAEILAAKF